MSVAQKYEPSQYVWGVYTLAVGASVTLAPLVLSLYGHSQLKVLLASVLLGVCLYPTTRYFAKGEVGLPALPVLCLAYAFQFAIPVFTREPAVMLAYGRTAYLDDENVVAALSFSVLGVCSLLAGYYGFRATRLAKRLPVVDLHLNEKKAVVYCVVVALLAPLLPEIEEHLPESLVPQLSALVGVVQNQTLVAIAIMGCLIYSGRGLVLYQVLLYWIVGIAVVQGLSFGMIEQAIAPIGVLFIIQWQLTRRLPLRSIVAVIIIIFFLSPVKHEYRRATWYGETPAPDSSAGKALLWIRQASQYWKNTFRDQQSLAESTEQAASRTDLIHQFALVCSLTPSEVPHQYGSTYSYFLVTLVPRVIWPEKPEAGGANKFYGVNYGLTTEEGAERSTFGVNLIAESYINFGWAGIILMMALQGIFLGLLQHLFGEQKSGAGGWAVYVSFFVFFLNGIGSSTDMLFGNVIQSSLLSCALLWWMRVKPPAHRLREAILAVPATQR